MLKIDCVEWGEIWVDGKQYHQVLIVGKKVFERDSEKLHQLFGTTHKIGGWEEKMLLGGKPEVIIIGNGWDEVLQVNEDFKFKIENLGIDLRILRTPEAVEEYNQLVKEGKKVNALIHTTC